MTANTSKRTVAEAHPELIHYTTAQGMEGILKSQTLWAIHAAHLNDSTEIRLFKQTIPDLIQPTVERGIANLLDVSFLDRQIVENAGGPRVVVDQYIDTITAEMMDTLLDKREALAHIDPFIVSFCTAATPEVAQDGLLSQWRSYGGFALIFDTVGLDRLLHLEANKWDQLLFGGDVVYSSGPQEKFDVEFGDMLEIIRAGFEDWFRNPGSDHAFINSWQPLLQCACRYKHGGFHEEREVRIVSVASTAVATQEAASTGGARPAKPVHHFKRRNGAEVPCVHLFEGITGLPDKPLPLKRIIVGPSKDQVERLHSVGRLLREHGLDIPVTASSIPYVDG